MKLFRNQTGSLHLVVLAAIVVLAVVGFAGYRVATQNKTIDTAVTQTAAPATLNSSKDIDQASAELDSTPVDAGVDPDQLDQDLNELL